MSRSCNRVSAAAIFLTLMAGCQKTPNNATTMMQNEELITSARHYIEQESKQSTAPTGNPRIDAPKSPYWQEAQVVSTSKGAAVLVPVFYKQDLVVTTSFSGRQILPLNQITRLLLYKSSSGYQAQLLTAFPDTSATNVAGFSSGLLFLESWKGAPITKYSLTNSQILVESVDTNTSNSIHRSIATTDNKTTDVIASGCGTVSGYNYSPALPGETYAWSESSGCDYTTGGVSSNPALLPSGEYASLARLSIGQMSSLVTIEVSPPSNIIANIADYLKCFSNYGGSDHTYQVTVCVDQPVPGSRTAWAAVPGGIVSSSSASNPVDAGHTWLVMTENFGSYSIVRNVGFYPSTNVFPWALTAQGSLGDNDGHAYNISLTTTVDNGQFFNILNYISQGNSPGYFYNLNTNNCTTFAIQALAAGNVVLPNTKGSWPDGGFGDDPGDLGEDIRNMTLSANMTRGLSYSALPNKYNCN